MLPPLLLLVLMMYVMGKEAAKTRKCNEKEEEICRLIEESMNAGSLGISAQG